MTHRITKAIKSFVRRLVMPKLCKDCRPKIARMVGAPVKHRHHRIKHRRKHRGAKRRKSGRKLRAGIHNVKIRGKMRKVRVLPNGRWRFMKS